jgi:hypothetical protein
MLLQLLAINHSNARENGVSTFFRFFALFCKTGFVDRRGYLSSTNPHHRPALSGNMFPPGPRPVFSERRRCLVWLGAALARDYEPRAHAAAAIPQNESQGAGIRPGDRIGHPLL